MIWFWFFIFLATAIFEACTVTMVSVWFSGGALVSMILAAFSVSIPLQILAFFFTSIALLLLFLFCIKKRIKIKKETKTNLDSIIDSLVLVEEEIKANGKGRVKTASMSWLAEELDGKGVKVGTWVKVVKISGATLVVVETANTQTD